MRHAARVIVLFLLLAPAVFAEESVKDFTFTTVDGKTVGYKAASGTPMVINIAAQWWRECKKEAPELQKAYQNYKNKGVGFIGVFVQSDDDGIRKFAETFGLTFPVGKDTGLAKMLGAGGIPVTVFIDKKGRIAKKHIGIINYAQLSSNIEVILK